MKTSYQGIGCESCQLKYCQNTSKLPFIGVLFKLCLQVTEHVKEIMRNGIKCAEMC